MAFDVHHKEIFAAVALVLTFVAFVPYFWSIWQAKTRPHVFSWLIWAAGTVIVQVHLRHVTRGYFLAVVI